MDPLLLGQQPEPAVAGARDINWHLFQSTYDSINQPLMDGVDGIVGALVGYVAGPMRWLIVAWIASTAIMMLLISEAAPLNTMFSQALRAAVVMFLISSVGTFREFVGTPLLVTLPTEIGNALSGTVGGDIVAGNAFDTVWAKSYVAGLEVYDRLPSMSLKAVLLSIAIILYWGIALAAIGLSFIVYLASHVLLAVLIALGPLAICCALFPQSKNFFSGWVSAAVSTILAQILIVALMALMIRVETKEIARLAAAPAGANVIDQLGALLGVGALLGIVGLLAKQIPAIATGVAGGVYHQTGAYVTAAANAARNAAGALGRSAGAIGNAASAATTTRSSMSVNRVAGRSLSGGTS